MGHWRLAPFAFLFGPAVDFDVFVSNLFLVFSVTSASDDWMSSLGAPAPPRFGPVRRWPSGPTSYKAAAGWVGSGVDDTVLLILKKMTTKMFVGRICDW